ncbi:cystatin-M-like [Tamandua tetradactyla]|uniref:cystatin-M-like n=1 Tax=Tamandua tetradactyla TaxID=48850 RepID=UPI0040537D2D
MAPPSRPRALRLALAALCLLALPSDARARQNRLMTGERKDLSPDDPQVQKAAQEAVATYNMGSNSMYLFRHTRITRAQSQLVAGILYYLSVEMENTDCRKNAVTGYRMDLTTCPLATGAQQEKLQCDFEVLSVPWKNSTEVQKQHCTRM